MLKTLIISLTLTACAATGQGSGSLREAKIKQLTVDMKNCQKDNLECEFSNVKN